MYYYAARLACVAGGSGYPRELRSRTRVQKAAQVARRMGRSLVEFREFRRKSFAHAPTPSSYAGYGTIGSKHSRYFFIQSGVKLNPQPIDYIRIFLAELELFAIEANAGSFFKYKWDSSLFNKNPPHKPAFQASSSPIPRILIWPIVIRSCFSALPVRLMYFEF